MPFNFSVLRQRRAALMALACALPLGACAPFASGRAAARRRVLLTDGDVRIDVIVDGEGPTVVLLPSSQRDSEDFDDLAARLAAAGFKVLRPQPRGMGASSGPMSHLSLHALAADVAATVRQLGGGRAVLVGHAYGHFVARVTDLDHPGLVRGVVVAGGAARTFPPGMAQALAVASDPAQPRDARLGGLRTAFFAPGNDPTPWLEGWHPELRETYRRAGSIPPKEAWWPVSHSPILDLQGAEDPWRPPATRNELKDVLGDKVTVQVVPRASHALIPEQPETVARAIAGWISTLPR
ncbi:pimeloyl-ACP methyl ester carboxylesterase [Variovorax paradoxus]|uniref:alpha/beta fold hydrolase n=1 Tax=Variovorax paradoxus TaxID=34073 RepID=UPI002794D928|nr:alpha/beta hydrolase [Variovorax paradoxus]MDQ0571166.1 pimeloyl-ACP methyl ester carboxylesterase [Variovorax paradoxus]